MGNFVAKQAFIPPQHSLKSQYPKLAHLIHVTTRLQHTVPALYISKKSRFSILYFHGNAEDLTEMSGHLEYLSNFTNSAVLAVEYPGYFGTTTASGQLPQPSEDAAYAAAEAGYNRLREDFEPNQIIIYGRSLGSGVATHCAFEHECAGLILQSPLLSCVRVVMPFSVPGIDMFCNVDKVHKLRSPTTIMHGVQDEVINVSHGKKLSELVPTELLFQPLFIEHATHNTIESHFHDQWQGHINNFLKFLSDWHQN